MSPDKILYVDDEPMALKYFERLVSPLAPVITALSVEAGKAVLRERGHEIAVLVTDQRMPGAHGNELLRFTREFHPRIVRMLTTAYSELGEAIEAINSGEIYRYITKPWELASLHADLRNALELAELRNERDQLLGQKLLVQQQGLLGNRLAGLAVLGCSQIQGDIPGDVHAADAALYRFARAALAAGCSVPQAAWNQWDHAGLLQAEARRGMSIARELTRWQRELGSDRSPERAVFLLAQATGGQLQGARVQIASSSVLTALLDGKPGDAPASEAVGWLAWLLWWNAPVQVDAGQGGAAGGWTLQLPSTGVEESAPPTDWLESMIEEFSDSPLAG